MYRVGFGDFFLVSVNGADGEKKHILIDCGVHDAHGFGIADGRLTDMPAAETDDGDVGPRLSEGPGWDAGGSGHRETPGMCESYPISGTIPSEKRRAMVLGKVGSLPLVTF